MIEQQRPIPLRDQLLGMDIHDRNTFLMQDEYFIDGIVPGFALGDIFFTAYQEKDWRPLNQNEKNTGGMEDDLPELLLFAGCTDFKALKEFTTERIRSFYERFSDSTVDTVSIDKSLHIVENLMGPELRRTGEPAVAHIYRNVVRMIEFIESANVMHQELYGTPRFTAKTADFFLCLSALHDFLEDSYAINETMLQRGGYRPSRASEYQPWADGISLYRYIHPKNEEEKQDVVSRIHLDFGNYENKVFAYNLLAMNRRGISDGELMAHLQREIAKIQQDPEKPVDIDPLLEEAAFITKCLDRLDNNATYPFYLDENERWQTILPQKIVGKAQENLMIFKNMTQVLSRLMGLDPVQVHSDAASFILKYDPTRWSKLVLAGVPLRKMYQRHGEGCGIPKMI